MTNTPCTPKTEPRHRYSSLTLPAVSAVIGIVYLVAGLAGGQVVFGVAGGAFMVAIAVALLLFGRRSETIQGLIDRRDERINALDLQATAATGAVLVVAILTAFVVEVARGQSGAPFVWLAAIGGLTYVVSLLVLRARR